MNKNRKSRRSFDDLTSAEKEAIYQECERIRPEDGEPLNAHDRRLHRKAGRLRAQLDRRRIDAEQRRDREVNKGQPQHRKQGIANALVARVAAYARDLGSPIVELTVHADNPAQAFYQRSGFQHLPHCLTYVLAGPALETLAEQIDRKLPLAG